MAFRREADIVSPPKIFGSVNVSGNASLHQGDVYTTEDITRINYRRFLDSLHFPEINQREESIAQAHDGTFEWIFSARSRADYEAQRAVDTAATSSHGQIHIQTHPAIVSFKDWLTGNGNAFWITGKPGSGKSTLCNFLSNHRECRRQLQDAAGGRQIVVLKHFFWSLGVHFQKDVLGFLRTMIWQFFTIYEDVAIEFWNTQLDLPKTNLWSFDALFNVLESMLRQEQYLFCLFVDGVDESSDQTGLIKVLQGLLKNDRVKLCVSGRPEYKLHLAFKDYRSLRLEELTYSDLFKFASDALNQCDLDLATYEDGSFNDKQRLLDLLLAKAQGVFVWMRVAVKSLVDGIENLDDWEALLRRLDEMPDEVHILYKQILDRKKDQFKRYRMSAARILKILLFYRADVNIREQNLHLVVLAWLCNPELAAALLKCDMHPRTITEMLQALKLDTVHVHVSAHCGGLVEVQNSAQSIIERSLIASSEPSTEVLFNMMREETRTVGLIHRTIGDFLEDSVEGREILDACQLSLADLEEAVLKGRQIVLLMNLAASRVRLYGNRALEVTRLISGYLNLIGQLRQDIVHAEHDRLSLHDMQLMQNLIGILQVDTTHETWFNDYIFRVGNSQGVVPPLSTEHAFLYWCICSGRVDLATYFLKAMKSSKQIVSPVCTARLMWMYIHDICTMDGRGSLSMDFVELLLDLGADLSISLAELRIGGDILEWMSCFDLQAYCSWLLHDTYDLAISKMILEVKCFINTLNVRSSLKPLPVLWEATISSFFFQMPPDYILLCPWDGKSILGSEEVQRFGAQFRKSDVGLRDSAYYKFGAPKVQQSKHLDKVLQLHNELLVEQTNATQPSAPAIVILSFDGCNKQSIRPKWFAISSEDTQILRAWVATSSSLVYPQLDKYYDTPWELNKLVFQHWPSTIDLSRLLVDDGMCEAPNTDSPFWTILYRSSRINDFSSALNHLGWSEKDIHSTKTAEFATWHLEFPYIRGGVTHVQPNSSIESLRPGSDSYEESRFSYQNSLAVKLEAEVDSDEEDLRTLRHMFQKRKDLATHRQVAWETEARPYVKRFQTPASLRALR